MGRRPGIALLEVVVSLGLLLIALSMVGAAFVNCDKMSHETVERSRALMLSEQIITYLDTGKYGSETDTDGTFGDEGPEGWSWHLKMDKDANVPGLLRYTIEILEKKKEGEGESTRPILVTKLLRAEKKNINLKEDYGLSDDQLVKLTESIPGGQAIFDPSDFDPTSLARMDMDTLVEMLPVILESLAQMGAGGAGGGLPPGVSADQVMAALGGAAPQGSGGQGGGDRNAGGSSSGGSRSGGSNSGSGSSQQPRSGRQGFGRQGGGGG